MGLNCWAVHSRLGMRSQRKSKRRRRDWSTLTFLNDKYLELLGTRTQTQGVNLIGDMNKSGSREANANYHIRNFRN